MKIKVFPSKVSGKITAPPSKSYLHRALLCAALADGDSTIYNINCSDDILATIDGITKLGAKIKNIENGIIIKGINVKDTYLNKIEVNVNQSGSTLRFLIPLLSLFSGEVTYHGKTSLFSRPLDEYEKIFTTNNLVFNLGGNSLVTKGKIRSGDYLVNSEKSSQFITGLLFTLPLLSGDSSIKLDGKIASYSYILMTIEVLKAFNINIVLKDDLIFIKGRQTYKPTTYTVEGDYSMAAFYLALGATNGSLEISNLNHNSLQGDKKIIDILKAASCKINQLDMRYQVDKSELTNIKTSIIDCIDLGPLLSVTALFCNESSIISDAEALKYKESDRLNSLIKELITFNAEIDYNDNQIVIKPKSEYYCNQTINTYDDHRLLMAFILLACNLDQPTIINGAECISKSYPNFFDDIKKINLNFIIYNDN